MRKREFDWTNIAFLTLSPVAAFIGTGWYLYHNGLALGDLAAFWVMIGFCGLAVTAGYHRYYSHRTYDCHPVLQFVYLVFGAAALENSVLAWASDHRNHHRFVDQEEDPYNIMKGIFWAHMGWIFYKSDPNRTYDNANDLKADALVMWQHRWYLPIAVATGFVLPTLIGAAFGRPLGGFLWGGLLRVVIQQHCTFLINSAAHFFGSQPYSNKDSSRDNWLLAYFTFGEGYHNYHHAFQGDYRNGTAWYHFDPAKWMIGGLSYAGLTWRLNRAPEWNVLKAKMEMELLNVRPWVESQPDAWREAFWARVDDGRRRLEARMAQMREAQKRYQDWARDARLQAAEAQQRYEDWKQAKRIQAADARKRYDEWVLQTREQARREAKELRVQMERRLAEARASSDEAWDEFRRMLREVRRQPALN